MRTTAGALLRDRIYCMIYGREGVGKTLLPMTLTDDDGKGGAYVTADLSGPTSLVTNGYPASTPVEVLPNGEDPFKAAVAAVESFTRDKSITVICIDGCTVICGRAVDYLSDGRGEKALGFDGWQQITAGFRGIESACEKATRAGKSVVMTAWEREPEMEDSLGGQMVKAMGRPFIQGQAKMWLPGNCDLVARMTSHMKKVADPKNPKKMIEVFNAELQVNASKTWLAKSRWALPNPCPADLRYILDLVQAQAGRQPKAVAK